MPRISAEERAAAAWRAGGPPPKPPRGLDEFARALWKQIVHDRPADHFRSGQLAMLEAYCRWESTARTLLIEQDIQGAAKAQTQAVALATKLRITPLADIDRKSGKRDEKRGTVHRLLGGREPS